MVFQIEKFDYAPWYKDETPEDDIPEVPEVPDLNSEPTIEQIKLKIVDLESKILEYQNTHDLVYLRNYAEEEDSDIIKFALADSDKKNKLNVLQSSIKNLSRNILTILNNIEPKGFNNKATMISNVNNLLAKNQELLDLYSGDLKKQIEEPSKLEAEYEASNIKTAANFKFYFIYLLFTIFICCCLFFIYRNPESGNLDMFILGMAVFIFSYYIYDYYF